jgi:hypothetical protein
VGSCGKLDNHEVNFVPVPDRAEVRLGMAVPLGVNAVVFHI